LQTHVGEKELSYYPNQLGRRWSRRHVQLR